MPNSDLILRPTPIFLGYALKASALPAAYAADPIDPRITEMCSVSDCLTKRPPK